MSNAQGSVSRKKVPSQVTTQKVSKNVLGSRQTSKENLEAESTKNVGASSTKLSRTSSTRTLTKKDSTDRILRSSSSKTLIKKVAEVKDSSDQIRGSHGQSSVSKTSNSTPRTSVATKVSDPTAPGKTRSKRPAENEKRGVSTIYMPKKPLVVSQKQSVTKESSKSTSKTKESTGSSKRVSSRERRKSRTLSPSEVKVLHQNLNKKANQSSKKDCQRESSPEYEYEDDFEDYESDFQECTESETSEVSEESQNSSSSDELEPVELQTLEVDKNERKAVNIGNGLHIRKHEEERMLDSGNYELHEARRRAARMDLMTADRITLKNISTEKPTINDNGKSPEVRSLPSSADEGFEDGRSGDFAKSLLHSGVQENTIIDNPSRIISKTEQKDSLVYSRGRELLQMIKLDTVEWSIFEATPIAYEEFISLHGKINTRQIATQTNEDCLTVEVQTEEVKSRNIWSQFPVTCTNNLNTETDVEKFKREVVGVGCDDTDENEKRFQTVRPFYDVVQLNEFLSAAGNVILALLEEKTYQIHTSDNGKNVLDLPFSEARIKLNVSMVNFLAGRPVVMIRYSERSSKVILTVHAPSDEEVEVSGSEEFHITDCCIACQWNICEPSRPMKLFYSSSNITAICFHPTNYNIVFAGLEDGSLSLWDLSENETYHRKITDRENDAEWVIRCPTFSTTASLDHSNYEISKIVAVKVLSKIEADSSESLGKFMPIQICSLDELGICTVWSVLRNLVGSIIANHDLGQSWWGKVRLVPSHNIQLPLDKMSNKMDQREKSIFDFRDMSVDMVDKNSVFIASNTSKVLRASRTGQNLQPSVYNGNLFDTVGTTCIENCPFDQPYFLVGCTDGTIRLHYSMMDRPLLQLNNINSAAPIKIIQWSRSKPLTIYALDEESKVHLWDLNKSDIVPMFSFSPAQHDHVGSMQLSPCKSDYDLAHQYMAFGLDNGTVEIHKLNSQFCYHQRDDLASELETFLNYLAVY